MITKIKNLIWIGFTLLVLTVSATYVEAITQRIPLEPQPQKETVKPVSTITPTPDSQSKPTVEKQAMPQDKNIIPANNVKTLENSEPPIHKYSQLNINGTTSISKTNPKINLSLRNSDVQQVLRMFADKAGLNIIFHNSARGAVTMDLVNVPINDAFRYVVQITGLSYHIDGKTIVVYSVNEPMPLGRNVLTTVPVKYVEASAIADFLNKNIFSKNSSGLSNSDIVITNPISNELLVFGTHNDILMVEKIVEKFDVKPTSTTFTLSNTTPKEMATLLCNSYLLTSPNTQFINAPVRKQLAQLTSNENILACNIKNQAETTQFASMNMHNLLITYFPQRGTLNVLGGSPQQIESIREFIKQNDTQVPQAYLEIVFLELNDKGRRSFDETIDVYSKYFNQSQAKCKQLKHTEYPVFITSGLKADDNLPISTWLVNYLITHKQAKLIANPRIVANNAKPAIVDMTSDYVKSKTKNGFEISSDNGLKFEITPLIGENGYVTLNFKPQYSTELSKIKTKGKKTEYATLLQRRNLNLKNVRVKDGETLIISGLTKNYQSVDKKLLKDKKSTKQSELVILVTPKIIKETK